MSDSQQIFYVVLSADSGWGEMPNSLQVFSVSPFLNASWQNASAPGGRCTTYILAKVRWPDAKRDYQKSIRFIAWHGPIDLGWGGCVMDVGAVLEAAQPIIAQAISDHLMKEAS